MPTAPPSTAPSSTKQPPAATVDGTATAVTPAKLGQALRPAFGAVLWCALITTLSLKMFHKLDDLWVAQFIAMGSGLALALFTIKRGSALLAPDDPMGASRLVLVYATVSAVTGSIDQFMSTGTELTEMSGWLKSVFPGLLGALGGLMLTVLPVRWLAEDKNRAAWVGVGMAATVASGAFITLVRLNMDLDELENYFLPLNRGAGNLMVLLMHVMLIGSMVLTLLMLNGIRKSMALPAVQRKPTMVSTGRYLALTQLLFAAVALLLTFEAMVGPQKGTVVTTRVIFNLLEAVFSIAMAARVLLFVRELDAAPSGIHAFADNVTRPVQEVLRKVA